MSDADLENFDDPALKAAVRRAWGPETAPALLRQRVSQAAHAPALQAYRIGWRTRASLGLAAAAMVLIALGIVFHPWSKAPRPGDSSSSTAIVLPAQLADALISRHEECCHDGDHHMPGLAVDPNDFGQVRRGLENTLGFPVLSAALPGSWQFRGGSICPVIEGQTRIKSGHLIFARGEQFVSLLSLPRSVLPSGASGNYSQEVQEHPLAGFVTPSGFYCLVGSSPGGHLTLSDMCQMRDNLRGQVAVGADHSRVTLADRR